MQVLLDCRMASWSGVGRYTVGLARALAARADVELVQVCIAGEAPPAPPGFLVRTVTVSAHPLSLHGALELGRAISRTDPEVVHCLHFPTPAPLQVPLVVTLHDLIPIRIPDSMPSMLKRAAYRQWIARAARLADRVIVPSRATAQDVSDIFQAAKGKLTVTPYAADDFSSGPTAPLPERLTGLTASPYLLAMGNTRPHKDLPTLLRAFGILAASLPDVRLVLVGPEPPGYLQTQLAGVPSDVSARVIFTGPVSDGELRALYSAATAFVCPSRYEGFGLPVLEAMALGTPVVCTDSASLPEVTGDAALLFPAGEHGTLATTLAHVLRDPILRHDLAAAGRERAARFTWAATAAATVAVYSAVLEDHEASVSGWGDLP